MGLDYRVWCAFRCGWEDGRGVDGRESRGDYDGLPDGMGTMRRYRIGSIVYDYAGVVLACV